MSLEDHIRNGEETIKSVYKWYRIFARMDALSMYHDAINSEAFQTLKEEFVETERNYIGLVPNALSALILGVMDHDMVSSMNPYVGHKLIKLASTFNGTEAYYQSLNTVGLIAKIGGSRQAKKYMDLLISYASNPDIALTIASSTFSTIDVWSANVKLPKLLRAYDSKEFRQIADTFSSERAGSMTLSIGRLLAKPKGHKLAYSLMETVSSYELDSRESLRKSSNGIEGGLVNAKDPQVFNFLNEVYKSERFKSLVSGFEADKAIVLMRDVSVLASTKREDIIDAALELVERYSSQPDLAVGVSTGIAHASNIVEAAEHPLESAENAVDAMEHFHSAEFLETMSYFKPELSKNVASTIGRIYSVGWDNPELRDKAVAKFSNVMKHYSERPDMVGKITAEVEAIYSFKKGLSNLASYLIVLDGVKGSKMDYTAFQELTYLVAHSEDKCIDDYALLMVQEGDFISQQTSNVVTPIAAIMANLGSDYYDNIKGLNEWDKQQLSSAFAYAKNLPFDEQTEQRGLDLFYSALKQTIDAYPDAVGDWAAELVTELQREEKGILRAA